MILIGIFVFPPLPVIYLSFVALSMAFSMIIYWSMAFFLLFFFFFFSFSFSNLLSIGKSCENRFSCIPFTYKCNRHITCHIFNCCYHTAIRRKSNRLCSYKVNFCTLYIKITIFPDFPMEIIQFPCGSCHGCDYVYYYLSFH